MNPPIPEITNLPTSSAGSAVVEAPPVAHLQLSEVVTKVEALVRREFSQTVFWIVAEISSLSFGKSGYCRMELCEKEQGTSFLKASIKGYIFRPKAEQVLTHFRQQTGRDLQKDMRILFQARITFHKQYGLSLDIDFIEPLFTLGELQQARRRSVSRLQEAGEYHLNRSLSFPIVPQRIAIISAYDAKGYQDFVSKLEANSHGILFRHSLFPAVMAGAMAPQDICRQIIDIFKRADHYDVIVIVRGGGGFMDCFEDYKLARAVARVPIPVLVGIGHTSNNSLVDEVAHHSAITPTAVADFLIERVISYERQMAALHTRIRREASRTLAIYSQQAEHQHKTFRRMVYQFTFRNDAQLVQLRHRLERESADMLNDAAHQIQTLEANTAIRAKKLLYDYLCRVDSFSGRIQRGGRSLLSTQMVHINHTEEKVRLLDPRNILKRGYSLTTLNGKAITRASEVKSGDTLITQLFEGQLISRVENKDE